MSKALEIDKISKVYGDLTAVDNVSFDVEPGEIFGLLGPNGAGKTTLISTIVTTEQPTSGRVKVFDFDVSQQARQAKAIMGVVPQEIINHGFFNLEEVLTFHSGYFGIWNNKERIKYLINKLGLYEHRFKKVKQLSGGMKRRLLIAKALVHDPKILILDEPTAGVDIELRESLWEFVMELKKSGVTVLLTTHYLEEAEQLCDRVGIIHRGQLRKVGPTQDLIHEFTQRDVIITLNSDVQKVEHLYLRQQRQNELHFKIPSSMSVGDLLSELNFELNQVNDLKISEGKLEDAFKHVLGGDE